MVYIFNCIAYQVQFIPIYLIFLTFQWFTIKECIEKYQSILPADHSYDFYFDQVEQIDKKAKEANIETRNNKRKVFIIL
jgi:NADH dehydrogenase FAD-containing subunit